MQPINANTVISYQRHLLIFIAATGLIGCSVKNDGPVDLITTSSVSHKSQQQVPMPLVVSRTSSSEFQVLARLAKTIEELEALVREAEASANPDARIRFDYHQLRVDILSIFRGIQAHIEMPVYTPRTLNPIVGNYGR